ncbi:MAG: PorP/SprF family type IX secretion system membrane protein [Bacteroidia bacterium]|nr:PorP/SprF family type IX secretion system membrane protein [Bacteroidia bacterium]
MKKIHSIIAFLFLVLAVSPLMAQEEPILSQYRTNMFLINPGSIGTSGVHELRLNFRQQWQSLNFSPTTAILSYQGFADNKNGLGFSVMHDRWGASVRNGFQAGYAFRMPVGYPNGQGQSYLALGLSVKAMQHSLDLSNTFFVNPTDVAISGSAYQFWAGDVAFGAYLYNDFFYLGVSSPNLIQAGTYLPSSEQGGVFSRLQRYFFLNTGYKFNYGNFMMEPSIMVRKIASTPYQMEGSVRFYFNDESLIMGLSYRTGWVGGLLAGINYNGLKVIYSADFMPLRTDPNRPFGPSHEITLGFDLGKEQKDWKRNYYVPEN